MRYTIEPKDVRTLAFTADGPPAINERLAMRASHPAYGPQMIETCGIRHGRPTSVFDLVYVHCTQQPLYEECRCVPCDHDYKRAMLRYIASGFKFDAPRFEVVQASELHRELMLMTRVRGRPTNFLEFSFDTLKHWRDAVSDGTLTIRDLAVKAEVSEPAASRFAHGELLWYV